MPQTTPTFRIFLSSTFADLKEERNALHRSVFPALKKLCEEHQARFQAIDLRWGVREEAALDQQTLRICLDEVKRCQEITPRPNFLILLGQRYGWRPVPPVIPADEFAALDQVLDPIRAPEWIESDILLNSWYVRDDNAVPPEYRLKPRVLREGQSPEKEAEEWSETEASLRGILANAAAEAHAPPWLVKIPGGFMFSQLRDPDQAEEERFKYEMSATEREIQNGALAVPDAPEHVFCFFRTITGLPNDATAEGYRDLIAEPGRSARLIVDTDSDRRLERLKGPTGKLRQKLPDDNFREYRADWLPLPHHLSPEEWTLLHAKLAEQIEAARGRTETQTAARLEDLGTFVREWYQPGSDAAFHLSPRFQALGPEERAEVERKLRRAVFHELRPPITTNHLAELCRDVQQALTDVILRQIQKAQEEKERERRTDLDEEIATHERFAAERLRSKRDPAHSIFVGRAAPLRRISGYLAEIANDPSDDRPRPLALIGEPGSGKSSVMAEAVEEARKAHPNALVISRFVGWTPGSAVVRDLLDKLCRQIAKEYGLEEGTPSDYRELVQEFPKRLKLALEKQPSRPLIIFLDALDQLTDADNARNLVWLPMELPAQVRLVVSSSTEPGDTEAVLKRRLAEECRFSLDEMPVEEADQLLRHWSDDAGRTLQGRAERYADSTGQWRYLLDCYNARPESRRPLYLKLAFEEARRWQSYDPESVTRLAPDIKSLIHQLFDRLAAPTNHGSTLVAAALGYLMAARHGLTEDEMMDLLSRDGALLGEIRKYHRPPEEKLPPVIWSRLYFDLERYLTLRKADGTNLFAFYHRQLEAVARERYLNPGRHRALAEYFAGRDLFLGEQKTPNIRKLSELPYQQTYAGDLWEDLYHTLTDFEFLEAKCTHVAVTEEGSGDETRKVYSGVYELQEDYRRALEVFPSDESA